MECQPFVASLTWSFFQIESVLKTAALIENACICVSEKLNDICALVTPNDKQLKLLAKEMSKEQLSRQELCADPEVKKAVMESVVSVCKGAGLHRREIPVQIHVCFFCCSWW